MLEAYDELGMYVMDETFDMWYMHKNRYDYASDFELCCEADVKAMIEKDFNHPSVIMYSVGNENSEPAFLRGVYDNANKDEEPKVDRLGTPFLNTLDISRFAQKLGVCKKVPTDYR